MTAVVQRFETVAGGTAARRIRLLASRITDTLLALALLPATLAVGVLVAIDVGFPLLVCVRSYDGLAFTQKLRFRTTRVDTHKPPHERSKRSALGEFLHRTRLADLPNIYFRLLFKI